MTPREKVEMGFFEADCKKLKALLNERPYTRSPISSIQRMREDIEKYPSIPARSLAFIKVVSNITPAFLKKKKSVSRRNAEEYPEDGYYVSPEFERCQEIVLKNGLDAQVVEAGRCFGTDIYAFTNEMARRGMSDKVIVDTIKIRAEKEDEMVKTLYRTDYVLNDKHSDVFNRIRENVSNIKEAYSNPNKE